MKRFLKNLNRKVGLVIFRAVFPSRATEACEIFNPNGHDVDGNHIDVALALNGKRIRTLPFDVFTPIRLVVRNSQLACIKVAWEVLSSAGFSVHGNRTEALQIHCDLC